MSQVIFFDGVCVLCNRVVSFLVERDTELLFRFAPLQGESAKRMLPPDIAGDSSSVVLWSQGQAFRGADALLMILVQLGGFYEALRFFWIVPRPLRDLAYRFVAKHRYRWFGRHESCRLPSLSERDRFLP